MFGLRIVTEKQIDKLVKDVSNDVVRACAQMAKISDNQDPVYLRSRFDASNEIYQLLQD